jgi:hypothetical protein
MGVVKFHNKFTAHKELSIIGLDEPLKLVRWFKHFFIQKNFWDSDGQLMGSLVNKDILMMLTLFALLNFSTLTLKS